MCAKSSVNQIYINNGIHIEQAKNTKKHYITQIRLLNRIIKSQEEEIVFLRKIVELTERNKNSG